MFNCVIYCKLLLILYHIKNKNDNIILRILLIVIKNRIKKEQYYTLIVLFHPSVLG